MNFRNILLSLALAAAATAPLAGQALVAGWDFSNFQLSGSADTSTPLDFIGDPSIGSNFTDTGATGRIWWDGTGGSTAMRYTASNGDVFATDGSLSSNLAINSRPVGPGFSSTGFLLTFKEQSNASFTVSWDVSGSGLHSMEYAARSDFGGPGNILWEWSADGVTYHSLVEVALTAADAPYALDLRAVGAFNFGDTAFLRGTFDTFTGTGGTVSLDNVEIQADTLDPLPEPPSVTYVELVGNELRIGLSGLDAGSGYVAETSTDLTGTIAWSEVDAFDAAASEIEWSVVLDTSAGRAFYRISLAP